MQPTRIPAKQSASQREIDHPQTQNNSTVCTKCFYVSRNGVQCVTAWRYQNFDRYLAEAVTIIK